MRLASCEYRDTPAVALIERDDRALLLPAEYGDMIDIIAGGEDMLRRLRALAADSSARLTRVALDTLRLHAPLRRFNRDILCTGWNYLDHFHESYGRREGQDVPLPAAPTFFTKSPHTVIGPFDDIAFDPALSAQWDYEAEVAIVFGKAGRSIPAAEAMDHVWGYCLANDVSLRDLQRRHGAQWFKGKSIDRTMPLGPWLVTADEVDPRGIRLQCDLNGTRMQDATTGQMAFPLPRLIAELTYGMSIGPGDVLLTGTPSGIGNARTPPVFLQEGDELTVTGSGLGMLRNSLVRADLFGASDVILRQET